MAKTERRARPTSARKEQKARKASTGILAKTVVMLAVVAALVLSVAIFFKVQKIEVQGNSIYSAERITQASSIAIGDNLLTLNKAAAVGNIMAELPYVEEASIGRTMPDTVIIAVKENEAGFAVLTDVNTAWLISSRGKAMERIELSDFETYPHIQGLSVQAPVMGNPVFSNDQAKLDAALNVLQALGGTGALEHIVSINVEKDYDIVMWYEDRYEVLLGSSQDMEYKIQYLTAILDQLSEYQAGTIDLTLSKESKASFRPRT